MVIPGADYQAHYLNTQHASYNQLRQQTDLIAQQNQILHQQALAEQAHYNRIENEAVLRRELLRLLHEINKYVDELLGSHSISIEQYLYFYTKYQEFSNRDFSILDSIETIGLHISTSDKLNSSVYVLRNKIDMAQKVQYYWILALLEDLREEEIIFDENLAYIDSILKPLRKSKKVLHNLNYYKRELEAYEELLPKLKKRGHSGKKYGIAGAISWLAGFSSIIIALQQNKSALVAYSVIAFGLSFWLISRPRNAQKKYKPTKSKAKDLKQKIQEAEISAPNIEWKINHFSKVKDNFQQKKENNHANTMQEVIRIRESLNILHYPIIQIHLL